MGKIERQELNQNINHLNLVDDQLAQIYEDSLIKLLHNRNALTNNVYVRRSSEWLRIAVFYGDNKAAIYTMLPDGDGWWRLRDTFVKEMKKVNISGDRQLHKDMEVFDASKWSLASPPTAYTRSVGTKFSGTFNGVGLMFNTPLHRLGGMWEFVVDGYHKKVISTWGASETWNNSFVVANGLFDGEHIYEATFLGEDPDGQYSEQARGYIHYNPNYPASSSLKTITPIVNTVEETGEGLDVLNSASRKEFAYRVKPANSDLEPLWIPEHGVLGVMRDIKSQIYVGDRKIDNLMSEPNIYVPYKQVRFITDYKGFHPSSNTHVWDGRLDQTINPRGFHIGGKMEFVTDTYIDIGYSGMLPVIRSTTKNDAVVTSKGVRHLLNYKGTTANVMLNEIPSGVAHFSMSGDTELQRNLVAVIELFDIKRTLRLGQKGAGNNQIVELRNDDMNKTYLRSHQNHNAVAGETFSFGASYFIGEIVEASDVLP